MSTAVVEQIREQAIARFYRQKNTAEGWGIIRISLKSGL